MKTFVASIALIVLFIIHTVHGQLSSTFYDNSCPQAQSIVKAAVKSAVKKEKRMGASLLRLHFHDCFVIGCDGSVLLDDNSTFTGEKTAFPNVNSLRGFDVIDTIKSQLEANCSGVVSCADIIAIAARDSVVELKGPTWDVLLGRRDSTTASLSDANSNLPSPASNLSELITAFQNQGLSTTDLVALSGAHTIGKARCLSFRDRIYNDSNINPTFATSVKKNCPSVGGDSTLSPLDVATGTTFDRKYYSDLTSKQGLLHSDQELFNGGSTDSLVSAWSTDQSAFFTAFGASMIKMGNLNLLTGTSGEIRLNCRKSN